MLPINIKAQTVVNNPVCIIKFYDFKHTLEDSLSLVFINLNLIYSKSTFTIIHVIYKFPRKTIEIEYDILNYIIKDKWKAVRDIEYGV